MMGDNIDITSSVSYASAVVIALSTIPSIWRLAKRSRRVKVANEPVLYEDEDGVATEESMAQYSVKWQFTSIFILIGAGLASSLGLAIAATVRKEHAYSDLSLTQFWLLFPSWVSCHAPLDFIILTILDLLARANLRYRFGN